MSLDPALTVPCPTCRVGAGQPCRSRRAISLHQDRRQALADLGVKADDLLAAYPRKPAQAQRQTVLVGRTGSPVADNNEEWPPWEKEPAREVRAATPAVSNGHRRRASG